VPLAGLALLLDTGRAAALPPALDRYEGDRDRARSADRMVPWTKPQSEFARRAQGATDG
jgi:hypothetical protein